MSGDPTQPSLIRAASSLLILLLGVAAWPFLGATTFFGDDHLFLAFARLEPHPLSVLWDDKHGGEYWRPLPMLLWWVLGRLHAGPLVFGAAALVLHGGVALLVARLGAALGLTKGAARLAGALFFIAPGTRDVGLWYAASTDLLAAFFVLASVLAALRQRPAAAVGLGALALLAKESAVVLPALAWWANWVAHPGARARTRMRAVSGLALVTGAWLLCRAAVVGGWGGAGEPPAGWPAKLLQIVAGLGWVVCPDAIVSGPVAACVGLVLVAVAARSSWAARRRGEPAALRPLGWVLVAALPLFAAGWAVGARYFYLAAVGLAWLVAASLDRAAPAARWVCLVGLAALGGAHAVARAADVRAYDAKLAALRPRLGGYVASGARHFVVQGGVKDLDLVVKAWPEMRLAGQDLVVLVDVPASFLILPPLPGADLTFLLAAPPLPPSGAYRFGVARIAAQARRGQEPDLEEVLRRLPDVRFLRIEAPRPDGVVQIADTTQDVRARLLGPGSSAPALGAEEDSPPPGAPSTLP